MSIFRRKDVRSWEEKKAHGAALGVGGEILFGLDRPHGELTKACELMARVFTEQTEKERLRFKCVPTVEERDTAAHRRG